MKFNQAAKKVMTNATQRIATEQTIKGVELDYMRNGRPRNDFVAIYVREKTVLAGIAVGGKSAEAKELIVVGVGPDVVGLERGDVIFAFAKDDTFMFLPGCVHLVVTRQANVAFVKGKCPPEEMPDRPGAEVIQS